jgi:hypothetical protein
MCSLKYGAFGHRVLHMENVETVQIRLPEESDPPSIAAAFTKMGWKKPETQYQRYLQEQMAGTSVFGMRSAELRPSDQPPSLVRIQLV